MAQLFLILLLSNDYLTFTLKALYAACLSKKSESAGKSKRQCSPLTAN